MNAHVEPSIGAPATPLPGKSVFLHSFLFLLVLTVASSLVGQLSAAGLRGSGLPQPLRAFLVSLPPFLNGALFPYLLIRLVYRSSLKEFGVRWIDPGRRVLPWLIGSGVVALAAWLCLWGLICGGVSLLADSSLANLPLTLADLHSKNPLHLLVHGKGGPKELALVVHMTLLVGFAEELWGRGFLQNALEKRYQGTIGRGRFSVRTSTVLAAVLFAFWHTSYLDLSPLGLLPATKILGTALTSLTIVLVPSFLLCLVYEKTRSILAVVVLHDIIDGGKLLAWLLWSLVLPG